jgi:glycosyltransferase involved in cell wall biosynthesis
MTPTPTPSPSPSPSIIVVLPALNEEESVAIVVKEVQAAVPDATILVVDDGSGDRTGELARHAGAQVVTNPFTLGVGGAMRVGFRVAEAQGYDVLLQVDADGQHDARDIKLLLAALDDEPGPQVVIGARFAGTPDFAVPRARRLAMRILAHHLSRVTGTRLTDVTSGFRAHNRAAVALFARRYPADYLSDTIESLIIVAGAGGRVNQVPVTMRPRLAGSPSQSPARAALYLLRVVVFLALSVFRRRSYSTKQPRTEAL